MDINDEYKCSDDSAYDNESIVTYAYSSHNNILNMPMQNDDMQIVISWDVSLFDQLCSGNNEIEMNELIIAYINMLRRFNINHMNIEFVKTALLSIKHNDKPMFIDVGNKEYVIRRSSFFKSLKNYSIDLKWRMHNIRVFQQINQSRVCIDWSKLCVYAHSLFINIICVGICYLAHLYNHTIASWIAIIYISKFLFTINLICYVCSCMNIVDYVPIAIMKKIKHTHPHGMLYEIQFYIFYICYVLAHVLQIRYSLITCRNGCNKETILIAGVGSGHIEISWNYFMCKIFYWFMPVIVIICGCRVVFRKRSFNTIFLYILAICIIIQQCMDKVQSKIYISIILVFGLYVIHRRRDMFYDKFGIRYYDNAGLYTKISIIPKSCMMRAINSFNCIFVNVKYSNNEWTRCVLTSNSHDDPYIILNKKDVSITMDDSIQLGYYTISNFRFYYLYDTICVFCQDTGIEQFTSIINDRTLRNASTYIKLVWVITDINIVATYHSRIISDAYTHISVYFSPSVKYVAYTQEDLYRFNYLQCIISYHTGIDILTGVSSPFCSIVDKLNIYKTIHDIILSVGITKLDQSQIGIFVCGNNTFIDNVNLNVKLMKRNVHKIKLIMWSECI